MSSKVGFLVHVYLFDFYLDVIPLTGPQCDLLPMHFFVDPGRNVDWNNLPEDNCTMMGVIRAVQDYLEVNRLLFLIFLLITIYDYCLLIKGIVDMWLWFRSYKYEYHGCNGIG